MPATNPYTPTVMATAMIASTRLFCNRVALAADPSAMTIISADNIKSVRMAPLILSFSKATKSIFSSALALKTAIYAPS